MLSQIELLSPAKDLNVGIAAINFGADAVYIGANKFGARVSAANSLSDIEILCKYAHKYRSKVYVTLNTLLFDKDLDEAQKLIENIYVLGADGLIIQDMGILEMSLPPIPIHISTQANNTNLEKIAFYEKCNIQRVVLARELSINQIEAIKTKTNIELEVFIHGALCVCYSGNCYLSFANGKRSGNLGNCAQPCRLQYDLLDKNKNLIFANKHFLSLKDLNSTENIKKLIEIGVKSFKIEGRLKDSTYVKNITAYYRKLIDSVLLNHQTIKKSSIGVFHFPFQPDPDKTFNRGFTDYFQNTRRQKLSNHRTAKSTGKYLGKIIEISNDFIRLDATEIIFNGDGLCYYNENNDLLGFNVNNVVQDKIYPNAMPQLSIGAPIYRNSDTAFFKTINAISNVRKIPIEIELLEMATGFEVRGNICELNLKVSLEVKTEKVLASNPENAMVNIKKQLGKDGDSVFKIINLNVQLSKQYFFTIAALNSMRRDLFERLSNALTESYILPEKIIVKSDTPYISNTISYKDNVCNQLAVQFYKRHGVEFFDWAVEKTHKTTDIELMVTKYCIKHELGYCNLSINRNKPFAIHDEPMFLKRNNNLYRLIFDCKNCEMKLIKDC